MNTDSDKNLYEQILDDTNQLIQISDVETFSMMYANKPARMFTNHADMPYKGEKCYEYMMGIKEQCPFCPMRQMEDKDSFTTEIDNGNQVFTVKTNRIVWNGKEAFIEYASDITTIRRTQQIFEHQMCTLINSIPDAEGIFHINVTQDKCISKNGSSSNLEKLNNNKSIDTLIKDISIFIPNNEQQKEFYALFCRSSILNASTQGKTELIKEILSYYDDGSIRWTRFSAKLITNPITGDLEAVLYGTDITNEKNYQQKIAEAEYEKQVLLEKSQRDILTNVYNKEAFEQLAQTYINIYSEQPFAIVFLDLDNFKAVNDTLGHLIGDKVIIETAVTLQKIFLDIDIISRFGGDEFCILVKNIFLDELLKKTNHILEKLNVTYNDKHNNVNVTASIGIAYCNKKTTDILTWINKADMALYRAKRNGRNQYQLITE